MSDYIKKTWVDGEVITAEGLNNLETGIVEAKKDAETVRNDATAAAKAAGEAKEAAAGAQAAADKAQATAAGAQAVANTKAPGYTYGTTDLTPGSSRLTTGTLHFVYE